MTYEPHLIAPFSQAVSKELQPWLIPDQAFEEAFDCYIQHGVINKREGYNFFANGGAGSAPYCESRIVSRITSAAFDTGDGGKTYGPVVLGNIPLRRGTVQIIDAVGVQTATDDGQGGFVAPHSGTVNYTTGSVTVTFTANVTGADPITATYDYHPGLPVMMIANFVTNNNTKEMLVCDTKNINKFNPATNRFDDITVTQFTGTSHDFFTWVQYPTILDEPRLIFTNNVDQIKFYDGTDIGNFFPITASKDITAEAYGTGDGGAGPYDHTTPNALIVPNSVEITAVAQVVTDDGLGALEGDGTGTINYETGEISVTFTAVVDALDPITIDYSYGSDYVITCAKLIDFKDRLILFRTTELGGTVHPQRIRPSGTGKSGDVFLTSASGAGVIDIPSQTWINGVVSNRDDLLFFTEKEHWILKYSGNDIVPFLPSLIDGSRGCDATFSPISYLNLTKAYSKHAFTTSDGYQVRRYDEKIPNFSFEDVDQDNFDLCFSGEILDDQSHYLIYPSQGNTTSDRILVNNYDENNFSIYKLPLSCMGNYFESFDITWDDLAIGGSHEKKTWEEFAATYATWNDIGWSKDQPIAIGGGHNGEIWRLNAENSEDNPLKIWNITSVSVSPLLVEITTDYHNYLLGDSVFFAAISGSTEINNKQGFIAEVVDVNTVRVQFEGIASISAYTSGGQISRVIPFELVTKNFNPYVNSQQRVRCGWIYFYVDTSDSLVTDDDDNAVPGKIDIEVFSNDRFPDSPTKLTSLDLKYETRINNFNDRQSLKVWRKVYINQNTKFIQFRFKNKQPGTRIRIHAYMLGFMPGGRLI